MTRFIVLLSFLTISTYASYAGPEQIYQENCQECHGENRLGVTGPALIPETIGRMRGPNLISVISNGRESTQMPAYGDILSEEQITTLIDYLKQPLEEVPPWRIEEITASRIMNENYVKAEAPVWSSDPLNITLVVETGDHHISVLDGDTFETLDRFKTPVAVHGGPKFTPDGRYVFIMSRDGWIQKYDLFSLMEVGRIRGGLNSRNIAISSDGNWLAVANYLPMTLTILSTKDLSVEKTFEVADLNGTQSRVSAVYQAPNRESFILALKDAPEIWEIFTSPESNRRSKNSDQIESSGPNDQFSLRRISISENLDDFFFDNDYKHLVGASRVGNKGVVINLEKGQEIAEIPLEGLPHLGSGISWLRNGTRVMATPHLREAKLSIINTQSWDIVKTIKTDGPGFFLRSHENTPYFWSDVFFGPNKDAVHIIDKQSLEIVKTVRPVKGATVAHVEFTYDGAYALVSVWENDGAIIVYDSKTLNEVMRLPMSKPSGKYNVGNKIKFSEGTSH